MTNMNLEEGGVVKAPYILPTKEKLARMRLHLSKLMRLVTNEINQNSTLYTQLMLEFLKIHTMLDNAEKGEVNVGRNSSYPE